ncbi:MAG: tol-pal system-associated acyl-CoA thioesterase [Pseudomonadota bacterium]
MSAAEVHRFAVRVYYEDTDLAGIVYYANYLRFIERARTEALRALGIDQPALKAVEGLVFVVRTVNAEYRRPAVFDDLLTVETGLLELRRASVTLEQRVLRDAEPLFVSTVGLAMMGASGRPARIPAAVSAAIGQLPMLGG